MNEAERLCSIRAAEAQSHTQAYLDHALFVPGSWLAKPVKTVLEILPNFDGYPQLRVLDLGCGVGRNCIPIAQRFSHIPCRIDCVDILELAIEKLWENGCTYNVSDSLEGIVSSIDTFSILPDSYDLILAVSALEHVANRDIFVDKLKQIHCGLRRNGIACLIVNSGVREQDLITGRRLLPQFEVNLSTEEMIQLIKAQFPGCAVCKHTLVHQRYEIPREKGMARVETDVVTYVLKKTAG